MTLSIYYCIYCFQECDRHVCLGGASSVCNIISVSSMASFSPYRLLKQAETITCMAMCGLLTASVLLRMCECVYDCFCCFHTTYPLGWPPATRHSWLLGRRNPSDDDFFLSIPFHWVAMGDGRFTLPQACLFPVYLLLGVTMCEIPLLPSPGKIIKII